MSRRSTLPYPTSLCHRCGGCRAVVSGRGSTFFMCTVRPEKYLAQPVRRCAAFHPAALVIADGPRGRAGLRWWGEPLCGPLVVRADGRGGLRGDLPEARPGTCPGNGLAPTEGGAVWTAAAGRGRWLAWVVEGADVWRSWPADAPIRLAPVPGTADGG